MTESARLPGCCYMPGYPVCNHCPVARLLLHARLPGLQLLPGYPVVGLVRHSVLLFCAGKKVNREIQAPREQHKSPSTPSARQGPGEPRAQQVTAGSLWTTLRMSSIRFKCYLRFAHPPNTIQGPVERKGPIPHWPWSPRQAHQEPGPRCG